MFNFKTDKHPLSLMIKKIKLKLKTDTVHKSLTNLEHSDHNQMFFYKAEVFVDKYADKLSKLFLIPIRHAYNLIHPVVRMLIMQYKLENQLK